MPSRPAVGAPELGRKQSAPNHSIAPQSNRSGPGVLVMAEDPTVVAMLSRVLGPHNADVLLTRSPGETLYALQTVGYERAYRARLVLIDALLPGAEGPMLVGALRRDPRVAGATIAILSSLSPQLVDNMARGWGADGYLLTSRGMIHFKSSIDTWLGVTNKP